MKAVVVLPHYFCVRKPITKVWSRSGEYEVFTVPFQGHCGMVTKTPFISRSRRPGIEDRVKILILRKVILANLLVLPTLSLIEHGRLMFGSRPVLLYSGICDKKPGTGGTGYERQETRPKRST